MDLSYEEQKLESYFNDDLFYLFKKYNVMIAGGAITSIFTNNEINDIDVYFRSKEDAAGFLAEMFNNPIVAHTKKATLFRFSKLDEGGCNTLDIQAIHYKTFDSPQDIFDSYDFTVCMGAYDFEENRFVFDDNFLKHNSQRALRFNKNTSFPLMSLLRVRKYEDKQYQISKAEMVRIILTCMNLDINSYEELKEQLGGMYGINLDKLFPSDKDEKFSLDKAIDILANLHLDENYLIRPKSAKFSSVDDLIENALGLKPRYFLHNNKKYRVNWDKTISDEVGLLNENAVMVDISEWLSDGVVYKYVKQNKDGRLTSFFNGQFEYKVDEVTEAQDNIGLFLGKKGEVKEFYKNEQGSILLEAKVKLEDFNGMYNGYPTFKKCVPLKTIGQPYEREPDIDMGW